MQPEAKDARRDGMTDAVKANALTYSLDGNNPRARVSIPVFCKRLAVLLKPRIILEVFSFYVCTVRWQLVTCDSEFP